MKHRVAGRKLGRTSAHRLAMLRNLSTALFDKERITTTLTRAKELRPFAEKLVTLSKQETLHARRRVARHIHDGKVVAKLFDTLSARYAARAGGYTRILRLGPRRGDNAEQALIELVGAETQAVATGGKAAGETSAAGRAGAKSSPKAGASTKAKAKAKAPEAKKAAAKPARTAKPAGTAKKSRSAADGTTADRRRAPAATKRGPSGKKGGD